jgi:hypothetical protein
MNFADIKVVDTPMAPNELEVRIPIAISPYVHDHLALSARHITDTNVNDDEMMNYCYSEDFIAVSPTNNCDIAEKLFDSKKSNKNGRRLNEFPRKPIQTFESS